MPANVFMGLFGVTWLTAMAYIGSLLLLALRVRALKREGKAADAPVPLLEQADMLRSLGWLLTGRYAELGDDGVTLRANAARVLFVVAGVLILTVFVIVLTQRDALNAQF